MYSILPSPEALERHERHERSIDEEFEQQMCEADDHALGLSEKISCFCGREQTFIVNHK